MSEPEEDEKNKIKNKKKHTHIRYRQDVCLKLWTPLFKIEVFQHGNRDG